MPSATIQAPANVWEYLGERPGQPFVPYAAQAEVFNRVKTPWPGFVRWQDHPKYAHLDTPPQLPEEGQYERRASGLYIPYPTVHAFNGGRRVGKTTIGEKLLWNGLLAPDDQFGPPTVRMTADTEEHAYKIWDRFTTHLLTTPLRGLLDKYSRDRELIQLKNGATAQMISGNNPDALAGDGVTTWVIDEMQSRMFTQAAWDSLFPSTSERNGVVIALGVCENSGPYRTLSFWGRDSGRPEFYTHTLPTSANPFVPRWRIQLAQRTLSPSKFKQLYLAEWVNELGAIFTNVEGCVNGKMVYEADGGWFFTTPPMANREYVAGLDLGRYKDWSILSIWRPDGELVAWWRFSLVDWELQKGRVYTLLTHYGMGDPSKVTVAPDSTGAGDPIVEDLQRMGLSVVPVQLSTNPRKNGLIDSWAIRLGAGCASYPRIPELVEEHVVYEATKTESGTVTYNAPGGGHDDWVISCALANSLLPPHNMPAATPLAEGEDDRQHAPWEVI